MLIWEGRVVSYQLTNVVVLEKLGRGGFVIVESVGNPMKRMMVHRSQLRPKLKKPKRWL